MHALQSNSSYNRGGWAGWDGWGGNQSVGQPGLTADPLKQKMDHCLEKFLVEQQMDFRKQRLRSLGMQGNSDSDRCSDSDRWSWPGVKRPLEAAEYSFTRKPQQHKATAIQIAGYAKVTAGVPMHAQA